MKGEKRWTVKRYLVEEFEGIGETKEEAIDYVNRHGDTNKITVKK